MSRLLILAAFASLTACVRLPPFMALGTTGPDQGVWYVENEEVTQVAHLYYCRAELREGKPEPVCVQVPRAPYSPQTPR